MNGPLNIDLHTHSDRSDGALTPVELVRRAAAAGVEVLALTDHDTIEGIEDAGRCAAACGVRLVPGVEISASWRAQAIHVLGLWIDPGESSLRGMLADQAERRRTRMRRICGRLAGMGLPGDALLAAVEAHPGLPTRTHLAAALLAGGHVDSADEAFRRYLGRGKAAHLAAHWPALAEVVGWIRSAGGVASLAHPVRYRLSAGARRRLLADFAAAGGTALEVVTGSNASGQIEVASQLALTFGLAGSVGSDFHNPQLPWNTLGRLAKLPDCVTPVWRGFGL
ncbi:MAG: PHP domain-containing protein [Steroidobacteraceae bacterium]